MPDSGLQALFNDPTVTRLVVVRDPLERLYNDFDINLTQLLSLASTPPSPRCRTHSLHHTARRSVLIGALSAVLLCPNWGPLRLSAWRSKIKCEATTQHGTDVWERGIFTKQLLRTIAT